MTINFSIVGIANYLSDEEITRITGDKNMINVILKPEPTNFFDPNAIAVLLDGKLIGHVRKADATEKCILEILNKSRRHAHCATIIGKSDGFMSFEAYMDYHGDKIEPTDREAIFHNWSCSFMTFQMPSEIRELIDVMDSMMTLLEQEKANKSNFQILFEKYKNLVPYGISKEFNCDRLKLYNMLKKHNSPDMHVFADEMIQISKMIHENNTHFKAYTHIIKSLKHNIPIEYSEIVKGYSLMSVQKEMKAFPHNLYECRKKIEDFPTRLFYEQIPQDKLFQFYSGIAICGFLGEGGKPKKKKTNNKGGRKPKNRTNKQPLINRIIGPKPTRLKILGFMTQMLEGKKGYEAGLTLCAFVHCNLLECAPWDDANRTFGGLGSMIDYYSGMQYTKVGSQGYQKEGMEGIFDVICDQIKKFYKEEIMGDKITET